MRRMADTSKSFQPYVPATQTMAEFTAKAIVLGVLFTLGWIPKSWTIGDGKYALLLGTNLYGLMLCFAGFLLPLWLRRRAVSAG